MFRRINCVNSIIFCRHLPYDWCFPGRWADPQLRSKGQFPWLLLFSFIIYYTYSLILARWIFAHPLTVTHTLFASYRSSSRQRRRLGVDETGHRFTQQRDDERQSERERAEFTQCSRSPSSFRMWKTGVRGFSFCDFQGKKKRKAEKNLPSIFLQWLIKCNMSQLTTHFMTTSSCLVYT